GIEVPARLNNVVHQRVGRLLRTSALDDLEDRSEALRRSAQRRDSSPGPEIGSRRAGWAPRQTTTPNPSVRKRLPSARRPYYVSGRTAHLHRYACVQRVLRTRIDRRSLRRSRALGREVEPPRRVTAAVDN